MSDQKILFLGAGEAGIGIADAVVAAMVDEGMNPEQARRQCWLFDSKGLVIASRNDLAKHKRTYAHSHEPIKTFLDGVEILKPTAIIGVSGNTGAFNRKVIERMASINEHPIIFALSNPTSKSECTAEQAYNWTDGNAIFASGSPFDPVIVNGRSFVPGQGNNVYIFPGVGLGVTITKARSVTDNMFLKAAQTLAEEVSDADLEQGRIYPSLTKIRDVSLSIATAVAKEVFDEGLAQIDPPENLRELVRQSMYSPEYPTYA